MFNEPETDYTCNAIYLSIYLPIYLSIYLSISISIYIYICICICMSLCTYIYIYIYTSYMNNCRADFREDLGFNLHGIFLDEKDAE